MKADNILANGIIKLSKIFKAKTVFGVIFLRGWNQSEDVYLILEASWHEWIYEELVVLFVYLRTIRISEAHRIWKEPDGQKRKKQ